MAIPKLRPGQAIDAETVNRLVDAANSGSLSPVGMSLEAGATGLGLTIDRSIQPVWGEITAPGPDDDLPHHYQWKEVHYDHFPIGDASYVERVAKWKKDEEILPPIGHQSQVHEAALRDDVLLHPAVEVHGHEVAIGTIVHLYPSRMTTTYDGQTHRFWLFEFEELRAFRLLDGLFPTGGITGIAHDHQDEFDFEGEHVDANHMHHVQVDPPGLFAPGWRQTWVRGEWMDTRGEETRLYAEHLSGFPAGDQFLSLGIGFGPSDYHRGTRGWAKYVPHGTQLDWDEQGEPVWRGEWQIVTLDAQLIALVLVRDLTIQPGEIGSVWTLPIKKGESGPEVAVHEPGGTSLIVFNELPVPLVTGSIHNIHFDRSLYIWLPVTPIATPHGLTLFASGSVSTFQNDAPVAVPLDAELGHYGLNVVKSGNRITNAGEVALIGHVSWKVTAERDMVGAADIDSILEASLTLDGNPVVGTAARLSSSRRTPPELGTSAVNSVSDRIIQVLGSGQSFGLSVTKKFGLEEGDGWRTVEAQCTLTFTSISSFLED
jgi:hypothetical protein